MRMSLEVIIICRESRPQDLRYCIDVPRCCDQTVGNCRQIRAEEGQGVSAHDYTDVDIFISVTSSLPTAGPDPERSWWLVTKPSSSRRLPTAARARETRLMAHVLCS